MVDQDFIGSIRTAEQQAEDMLEAAKQQALASVEQARVQAAEIIASARKQAEDEQNSALEAAQKEVERIECEAAELEELDVPEIMISDAAKVVSERIVSYSVDR